MIISNPYNVIITPLGNKGLKGTVQAPASKSSMQRACAAALVRKGETIIHNPGHSDDDKAALGIIQKSGATVVINNEQLIINNYSELSKAFPGGGGLEGSEIDCGESGLSVRMFTPLIALFSKKITITGSGSLLSRPMDFFDTVLPQLGVSIKSNYGKLPITIQGPLKPANIEVDGSLSSQFLTGLLMAYGSSANFPPKRRKSFQGAENSVISIKVQNLKSKPYIDLTLDVMKKFGLNVPENRSYKEFIFYHNPSKITPPDAIVRVTYTVEADWSSGAFLLVAGAIAGPVTVRGLDLTSLQADKKIIDALMSANAGIAIEAKGIKIHPAAMNAFDFDATDCPDLFPPLVALAAYCNGKTSIKGVSRLIDKESNRALTLKEEFGKMGVTIELNDDIMMVHGGEGVKGAGVHSRNDHRIAMACAVAALKADGETIIEEAQVVKKSYPDFYDALKSFGALVSLQFQINL